MLHAFSFHRNGETEYFVFDCEKGSLYYADFPIFLLVKQLENKLTEEEKQSLNRLPSETVKDAREELNSILETESEKAEREKFEYKGKNTTVKALCLHICHDCNLCCEYCFASGGTYKTARQYMSEKTAKAAIDFLIANSGFRKNIEIDFFGGEPLLNFDVVKSAVDYGKKQAKAHNKVLTYTMTTNAVLLDKETIDFLNEEMDNVVISVDGRRDVHERVRKAVNNESTYDVILNNAKEFVKVRGSKRYYIRGTFTALNTDFAEDVKVLSDEGFHQISIEPVVLPKDHKLAIRDEQIPQILDEYERLANLYLDRFGTEKWFSFFHVLIDLENGPCLHKRLNGCGAGSEYLAILPNGDIYPCHQFAGEDGFLMGNVLDGGDFDREIQSRFASVNVTVKSECKDCFAKYTCSGGCAANAYHYEGDITKVYPASCEMARKRLETALVLYAKEKDKK